MRSLHQLTIVFALATSVLATTAPQLDRANPRVQNEARQMTRVIYLPNHDPSQGVNSLAVQYGAPTWRDDFGAEFAKLKKGKRWRCGKDHWTTLDTNIPIGVGRKKLAAGSYYLVLENNGKGKWSLVILDPAKMRRQKMDAIGAHATKGGTVLPLTATAGPVAKRLSIELTTDEKKKRELELTIRFGPHVLRGQLKAKM